MLQELQDILPELPALLKDESRWTSLWIKQHPPQIYRLSLVLSPTRTLLLHKVLPCEKGQDALMHSHSWPFALKVLEGGYEMGVGFSTDRAHPPDALYVTNVVAGTMYEMSSPHVWHTTKPHTGQPSYSVMLIGPRSRERLALNNDSLTEEQRTEMFYYFRSVSFL